MTTYTIAHRLAPDVVLYLGEIRSQTTTRHWPDPMQRIWTQDVRGALLLTWDASQTLLTELRRLPEFADQVLEVMRLPEPCGCGTTEHA